MTNRLQTQTEAFIKAGWEKVTAFYQQTKEKAPRYFHIATSPRSKRKYKKRLFNFVTLVSDRWKMFGLIIGGILVFYYGLGAAVSSKINNKLDVPVQQTETSPRHTTATLLYILKAQMDDQAWTPALPLIFPAAVLDNLPNFQIGSKNTVAYFTKKLSRMQADPALKEATTLLNYPPDIWLFSQTAEDKFSPGSAKQYRKAMARIAASDTHKSTPSAEELPALLDTVINLLEQKISLLNKQIQEHSTDIFDYRADDVFYQTTGTAYALHYMLTALEKDYQSQIVQTEQYENLTSAQKFLEKAVKLDPLFIKNAQPTDVYAANHLLYLAYYLSEAENRLLHIRQNIIPFIKDHPNDD
jgi:hypothetical protein